MTLEQLHRAMHHAVHRSLYDLVEEGGDPQAIAVVLEEGVAVDLPTPLESTPADPLRGTPALRYGLVSRRELFETPVPTAFIPVIERILADDTQPRCLIVSRGGATSVGLTLVPGGTGGQPGDA